MSKRKASSEADRVNDNNLSYDDINALIYNRQSSQLRAAFEFKSFHDVNFKNDDSLLMRACKIGDDENVMTLLEFGADLSFESHYSGHTALSLACLHGHESIVKLLLKHKADPNTPHGHLPLVKACEIGNIAIAQLLLAHGAKVDKMPYFIVNESDDDYDSDDNNEPGPQYRKGLNALMMACSKGYIDLVHVLIGSGAKLTGSFDSRDETESFSPFTFACRGYHWELVKHLIGLGADVNEKRRDYGLTPLMFACTEGNLDAVKMLLSLGADISMPELGVEDPLAPTPLSSACLHGHIELVKYILDHKDFTANQSVLQKAFIEACEHGDPELIALLRPQVGDINDLITWDCQSRTEERTLLSFACSTCRVIAAQRLLALGAIVSVKGDRGYKALSMVRMGGPSATTLIALLVEHGADVNSVDQRGNTPLMTAAHLYHLPKSLAAFKALLNYGADVRAKNMQGQTVLDTLTMSLRISSPHRRFELIDLCKQYEESNRRDRPLDEMLLK